MKRRDFLSGATSGMIATLLGTQTSNRALADETTAIQRDFIEIRIFWVEKEEKKNALIEQIDEKLIPLRNKLGFDKIGVFSVNDELHQNDGSFIYRYKNAVFVISSHSSITKMITLEDQVRDSIPASDFLNNASEFNLYSEQDCSLLQAFPSCPKVEIPTKSPERVIQLRYYYSPNYERNQAKLNMFDVRGELDLFRRCQMNPVFFGKTIYGQFMPNITYMLSFENDEARKKGWDQFVSSDEWKTMSGESQFENTAIKIRNLFLKPSPKSQI
ncbi:MAG: NIPSNAP family protein [Planctomycetia bacterium]|nr:NIPSNAP family protein [Planctomycetia bacterium]